MERWLNSEQSWKTVVVPCAAGCLDYKVLPISPCAVIMFKESQIWRSDWPELPTLNDFWAVRAASSDNCRQLSLPTLLDTDRLQLIEFDDTDKVLSVLMDDPDENNTVTFKQFRLEVPDPHSLDGIKFTVLNNIKHGRVEYRAPRFQPSSSYPRVTDAHRQEYKDVCALLNLKGAYFRRPFESAGMTIKSWDVNDLSFRHEHFHGPKVYTVRDARDGSIAGQLTATHHCNHGIQAFAGDYILLPGEGSGEDAFYGEMRLFNWRTGECAMAVKLPYETNGYIETEWPRGLLPSSSIWFVHAVTHSPPTSVVCFYGA